MVVLAYVVALLAAIVELPGHSNCERELGDGDRHGDEGGAVSDEGEGGYGNLRRRRSYNRLRKVWMNLHSASLKFIMGVPVLH